MEIGEILAVPDTKVTVAEVQSAYFQVEAEIGSTAREDVLGLIEHYPVWHLTSWPVDKLATLKIFYDHTPWTEILTHGGRNLTIASVADNFLNNPQPLAENASEIYQTINTVIENWRRGIPARPVFIIPGSKYIAPVSDFLDGAKRTLGTYIYYLETHQPIALEVYVGQKTSLWQRALKKLGGQ